MRFSGKISCFFVVFQLTITGCMSICVAQDLPDIRTDFVFYVNQNREHILASLERQPLELDQIAKEFNDVLKQGPIQEGLSKNDRESIFHTIASLGLHPYTNGSFLRTGFIEDDIILGINVYALFDSERDIRDFAFGNLLEYSKNGQLKTYSDLIREAMNRHTYSKEPALMSLLVLNEQEKNEILKKNSVSLTVRARLGDMTAESELINNYTNSVSFAEKRELIKDLGFVGSQRCGNALAASLKDNMIIEGVYDHISIRCYIIRALGKIHPDNLMLTNEINIIIEQSDDYYGGDIAIRGYLTGIFEWAENTYGVELPDVEQDAYLHKLLAIGNPLMN